MQPFGPLNLEGILEALKGFLADEDARSDMSGRARRMAQQGARGFTTGVLGGPVDLANLAMGGKGGEKPVGGGKWLGEKLEGAGLLAPEPKGLGETGAGLAGELATPGGILKKIGLLQHAGDMGPAIGAAINAFQGSPHRFQRHEDRMIGAGEGTQYEGWGHYLSSAKSIARKYAGLLGHDHLKDASGKILIPGSGMKTRPEGTYDYNEVGPAFDALRFGMVSKGLPPEQAYIDAEKTLLGGKHTDARLEELLNYLKEWKTRGAEVGPSKNLYSVEMRWPSRTQETFDPLSREHFLDRDTLLEAQPRVASRIGDVGIGGTPGITGAEFYRDLVRYGPTGKGFMGDEAASKFLYNDLRIPGMMYKDYDFKAAPEDRNFVVFKDILLNILGRESL